MKDKDKFKIKFFKTLAGTPQIRSEENIYSSIAGLSSFFNVEQLENSILAFANDILLNNDNRIGEWIEPVGGFIRIFSNKVQFGQYVDENLACLEQFEAYADDGEKIIGEISLLDFIEITKSWIFYLKTNK